MISSLPLEPAPAAWRRRCRASRSPYDLCRAGARPMTTPACSIRISTAIPADIDVLMIAHPAALDAAAALGHRPVRAAAAGARWSSSIRCRKWRSRRGQIGQAAGAPSSDLPQLLQAGASATIRARWSCDRALAQQVQTSSDPRNPVVALSAVAASDAGRISISDDPVTANLQALNLASAGALRRCKGATTTFAPLVASSDQAALLDAAQVQLKPRAAAI